MICADTTFLVDLWRNKDNPRHPAVRILGRHEHETFAVPAHAAGEFLEGGACISEARLEDAMRFLKLFQIGDVDIETAKRYARIVADLRRRKRLLGSSKTDLWIAAWALEHGAMLVSRNRKHFEPVTGLHLIAY